MSALNRIRFATWNVFELTSTERLRPHLRASIDRGTHFWFMQEAGGNDIDAMLHNAGLETHTHEHLRLAWIPSLFVPVVLGGARLSPKTYHSSSGRPKTSEAAYGIFSDHVGRTFEAWCYHTPAHVQPPDSPPLRVDIMVDSFEYLGERAEASEARAFIIAGDSNWDPDTGRQIPEVTTALAAGGIRTITAPEPTLGNRQIDHFGIIRKAFGGGFRHVLDSGAVFEGGGADHPPHKMHEEVFEWR